MRWVLRARRRMSRKPWIETRTPGTGSAQQMVISHASGESLGVYDQRLKASSATSGRRNGMMPGRHAAVRFASLALCRECGTPPSTCVVAMTTAELP